MKNSTGHRWWHNLKRLPHEFFLFDREASIQIKKLMHHLKTLRPLLESPCANQSHTNSNRIFKEKKDCMLFCPSNAFIELLEKYYMLFRLSSRSLEKDYILQERMKQNKKFQNSNLIWESWGPTTYLLYASVAETRTYANTYTMGPTSSEKRS